MENNLMKIGIRKHILFCLKYPECVIGGCESELTVQYMINSNITPIVDYFLVGRMCNFYNMDTNIFYKFKDIKKDWNDMIK